MKRLQGQPGYRLRIGEHRVIFDEDRTIILTLTHGPAPDHDLQVKTAMPTVQFIVSPSGDELAVLPRSEYERLAALANEAEEDAADAAAYTEAKAEWEAEGGPTFPPDLSALLLKAKSRLAAIRKWRGLSQEVLAGMAEIKQGYLSDLETGRRAGAPATIERLAKALDVPEAWLS